MILKFKVLTSYENKSYEANSVKEFDMIPEPFKSSIAKGDIEIVDSTCVMGADKDLLAEITVATHVGNLVTKDLRVGADPDAFIEKEGTDVFIVNRDGQRGMKKFLDDKYAPKIVKMEPLPKAK